MSDGDLLYFNGVDAASGRYALAPMTRAALARRFILRGQAPANLSELRWRHQQKRVGSLGVKAGVDPADLAASGWAIIFAADDPETPAIKAALAPLLELRREQAGPLYRELDGEHGLQAGETKTAFLKRFKVGPGPVDPARMPYYLLLVGDAERIPFSVQYQLDVQYAVGRLHFDSAAEYGAYARSVVAAETGAMRAPRRAAFFGVEHPGDPATAASAQQLVAPLARLLAATRPQWAIEHVPPERAGKARLQELLGGTHTPALLFTASHGMYFPPDDPAGRHLSHQGALLCNWGGPDGEARPIEPGDYLSADDLGDDASLQGLIAFHVACFGAGTPRLDDFDFASPARAAIAPQAQLSRLPRRMLGHPAGGALAVVGHIERSFPSSYLWGDAGPQLAAFESTLSELMAGKPVGLALEYFNERYSELATVLSARLGELQHTREDEIEQLLADQSYLEEVTGMWMATNDARNYLLLGDPAVRLPAAPDEGAPAATLAAVTGPGAPAAPPPPPPADAPDSPPPASPPPAGKGGNGKGDGVFNQIARSDSLTPFPVGPSLADKEAHPQLYAAWVKHTENGYKNSDEVFATIFKALLRSHYSTVAMYWILFAMGVGFFSTAVVIGLQGGNPVVGIAFGGLGVVAFLTYFFTRSSQAIEENLLHIAWLGMLYNSYWTRLNWTYDRATALAELDKGTDRAITQMQELIASHAATVKQRPGASGPIAERPAPLAPAGGAATPEKPAEEPAPSP